MASERPAVPVRTPEHAFEKSPLWKLKVRLQFTGWLQYLPNLMVVVALLLLAAFAAWIGVHPGLTVGLPVALAVVAAGVLTGDLATVRFGLHPDEPIPPPRTDLDAFDLMRARVSCRSFQSRDLTDAHRERVLDLADRLARPERQLGDAPIRFEYLAAPLSVWPVVGAHEFLVAIAPRAYDRTAVIDVGRSLQKVVLEATRLGLATCWIGPGADPASAIAHLGDRFDPEADHVICVCAIGYASRYRPVMLRVMQRSMRRRRPLAELFYADGGLTEPLDVSAEPFRRFGRCFEVCAWSPSSYNGQTTRAVGIARDDGGRRAFVRMDFGAATRSRYYAPVAVGIWLAQWEAGCAQLGLAGRFVALPDEARGGAPWPSGGRYDVSWLPAD